MINVASSSRRFLACAALALLASAPAQAATYKIGLFQGGTGTGSGELSFTNPGSAGAYSVSGALLSTNASAAVGARDFAPGPLNVQVAWVNFTDSRGNRVRAYYVEGLTGTLQTAPAGGLAQSGQCSGGSDKCFYRITFAFSANDNPNLATKGYKIELFKLTGSNEQYIGTPVPNGTYSVSNINSIPEPGALALFALALAALSWVQLRRQRKNPVAV